MLTFACVFLFKIATKWKDSGAAGIIMDTQNLCILIERVIDCLKSSQAGERHLIYRIAAGLEKLLQQYQQHEENGARAAGQLSDRDLQSRAWDNTEAVAETGIDQMETGWETMGFFNDYSSGFGMGINQFLNTQIQF
jgi:hypothetical protein